MKRFFNKKIFLTTLLLIVLIELVIIAGIMLYLLKHDPNQGNNSPKYAVGKPEDKSVYNISAEIGISRNIVSITEEIILKSPQSNVLLYMPSINSANTSIKNVSSSQEAASYTLNSLILYAKFNLPTTRMKIEYQISLDKRPGILRYDKDIYYLTNFLATPAVYSGRKPVIVKKSSFGDPYVYDVNNYYITFKTPRDYKIAAPGDRDEHIFGANKITEFRAINLRDFPAILYKKADVYSENIGSVKITCINSKESLKYAKTAFEFAQKNIGPYPYNDFFIVSAPLEQKGMEFSNMIFISDTCFKTSNILKNVTYHEVFHQWFYGIIGTNQQYEPFLDEGLVNYLALQLYGYKFKNNISMGFLNKRLEDYSSKDQYYELAYNDSSAYFWSLNTKLGNNFSMLLGKLYKEKKFKTIYFNEFKKYVEDISGRK